MKNSEESRSLVESMIDSMLEDKKSEVLSKPEDSNLEEGSVIHLDEGQDVVCPDCGNTEMIEGFVESEDSDTASLAYACPECDLKLVSDEEFHFDESDTTIGEIDPDNPACPICKSGDLNHQMAESEDGSEQLILDCGGCGASMSVISDN